MNQSDIADALIALISEKPVSDFPFYKTCSAGAEGGFSSPAALRSGVKVCLAEGPLSKESCLYRGPEPEPSRGGPSPCSPLNPTTNRGKSKLNKENESRINNGRGARRRLHLNKADLDFEVGAGTRRRGWGGGRGESN